MCLQSSGMVTAASSPTVATVSTKTSYSRAQPARLVSVDVLRGLVMVIMALDHTRGLWLVLLELTVVDFAWGFVPWAHAGVIWILGWSMVAMALIVRLPVRWIAVLGLGMIATHNLLDGINPASFGRLSWLWILLHSRGRIPLTAD